MYKDNPWYKNIEQTIMIPRLGRSFCTFKCYLCFTSASTVYYRTSIAVCCPRINDLKMTVDNLEIPPNATIRQEYVKCGDPDCENSHGPYLYAYWKHDKKLIKKYVGKNFDDFRLRKLAKEIKLRPCQLMKFKLIQHEASKGNAL